MHDSVCPSVAEYTTCVGLKITVADLGATGWSANSSPANGTTSYNSRVQMSSASWAQTVSHEIGGHHDAWNELVDLYIEAEGVVQVTINTGGAVGEIMTQQFGDLKYFPAVSQDGKKIPVGTRVRIVDASGSTMVVEPVPQLQSDRGIN